MLGSYLVTGAHVLELPATKDAAIRAAVDAMAAASGLVAADVLDAVLAREKVMSTGMGHGVAIPHAKLGGISDFRIGLCRSQSPIDYQSLDSTPVRILVLILSPEDRTKEHVKVIAEVTKRLKFASVRQGILDAGSVQDMESAILNHR